MLNILLKNPQAQTFSRKIAGRFCLKGGGLFFLFASLLFSYQSVAQGTWVPLTNLAPNTSGGVMLLLTDGTVLCKTDAGGGQGKLWSKLTPDSHGSYINGTWTTVAAMAQDRLYFSSQVLRDGRVYVCGGEYGAGGSSGEVYNPLTNSWTACPSTGFFISDANSEILPDGRVLQAAVGSGTRHTRLWDPVTNTYALGPDCLRTDNEAAWLKLPDNSILFIDNYSTSSERYIPATNTWINDGAVPVNVYDPFGDEAGSAYLLPDGRCFFLGSSGHNAYYTPSGSTAPGTWAAGPDFPSATGTPDAASAMMVNGKILCAVSPIPTSADHFPPPTSFYEFDYVSNSFTATGAPGGGTSLAGVSSYITNMLDLPDGTVLFVLQGDNQYYEYQPTGSPLLAGKPAIGGVFRVNCDTFMATGTLFNGISEGAGYGDDWQMSTNYPIIRLTQGTNVYYCRTYNWNSTGVMRGASPDTTMFVIPGSLPAGMFTMEVVVNGNPSATFPFNNSLAISPTSLNMCPADASTLTDVWTGGTWTSGNIAVATVGSSSGTVTGVAAGTTNITYSFGPTCFASIPVTVNAGPAAINPPGGINVCVGSATTLSDPTPSGIWSSGSPGIATVGASSGTVTGIAAGTATISYTLASCSATKVVTVNALPGATITPGGPTTFCTGGSVVLTANAGAGYTYQWQLGGFAIAGATDINYTASSAGNYTVIVTSPQGCSSLSATTVVAVNTPPPAVITPAGPTSFCAGGSVVLNANFGVGYTYQWQLTGVDIPGATAIGYTASSAGDYTVVVTNGGCSATSSPVTITIIASPAPITGTLSVCVGATTPLNDATPGGTWSSSNPTVATISSGGVVTGMGSGGVATISYTIGTGCASIAVVTVNSATAGPITGSAVVCIGQATPLADVTPGGTWSSSNIAVATVGSGSGVVTGVAAGVVTISYDVTSACGSATATRSFTVNAAPSVLPITGTTTICPGTSTTLADATPGGVWSSTNPAIATVSPTGVVNAVTIGTDTIRYTVTNASGCSTSSMVTFVVFTTLSATITPSGPTTFCTGANVVLTASAGISYQWQLGGVNIPGATAVSYTANASGTYTVLVTASGGCNAVSSPVVITVNPSPVVRPVVNVSASPGTILCVTASPVTFTATPTNGGATPSYQWYVNGVGTAAGSVYTYTPASGDIVTCVLTSSDACAFPVTVSRSDTVQISPMQMPAVAVTAVPSTVCSGDTIRFHAVPTYGGTAPTYVWKQNGVNVATGQDYIYVPGNGDILICTMTSNYPCLLAGSVASSPYVVHVQPSLPNIVTINVTQSSIISGMVDTFTVIAPNDGTSPAYQWLLNGSIIPGATNAMYITHTLANGDVISCWVASSNPCVFPHSELSNGVTVTVQANGVLQLSTGGSFTLVPNPNKGEFTIQGMLSGTGDQEVMITATDVLGRSVYAGSATALGGKLLKKITLAENVANGMYLVSLTSGEQHVVFHVIIEK